MTSIINLPATYNLSCSDMHWFLFCEEIFIDLFVSKQQAEQAAHEHYKQNNFTAEDQAEQNRHPIGA